MLRMYISPEMTDWDELLMPCEFAYNNAIHKATGYSPFQLAFGRHPVVPASLVEQGCSTSVPAAEQFLQEREVLRREAAMALETAQAAERDRPSQPRQFDIGEKVWLSTKHLRKRGEKCKKLLPKYMGPFIITARIGKAAYKLDLPSAMSRLHPVFHVSLLAKHYPRLEEALEDPRLFDAVSQQPDRALLPLATVLTEEVFHKILRQRESVLDGQNVRDYLVSCREGADIIEKWLPGTALPQELVASYWNQLAQAQLALSKAGPRLVPPPSQVLTRRGATGMSTLGL